MQLQVYIVPAHMEFTEFVLRNWMHPFKFSFIHLFSYHTQVLLEELDNMEMETVPSFCTMLIALVQNRDYLTV